MIALQTLAHLASHSFKIQCYNYKIYEKVRDLIIVQCFKLKITGNLMQNDGCVNHTVFNLRRKVIPKTYCEQ